jgi:hypothetical protein
MWQTKENSSYQKLARFRVFVSISEVCRNRLAFVGSIFRKPYFYPKVGSVLLNAISS